MPNGHIDRGALYGVIGISGFITPEANSVSRKKIGGFIAILIGIDVIAVEPEFQSVSGITEKVTVTYGKGLGHEGCHLISVISCLHCSDSHDTRPMYTYSISCYCGKCGTGCGKEHRET